MDEKPTYEESQQGIKELEIASVGRGSTKSAVTVRPREPGRPEHKAQNDLQNVSKLNDLLLDSLPHPAMLIRRDQIVMAANRIARQVGTRVGDYCWKSFGKCEYIPEPQKRYLNEHNGAVPPGGCKCVYCLKDEAFQENRPTNNPEVKAFGRIWDIWWVPINDELYLHYAIDITDRKRAEEVLRLHKEMVDNMAEGVVLARDVDGQIVYTNSHFDNIFGYSAGELIGEKLEKIYAPISNKAHGNLNSVIGTTLKNNHYWHGEVENLKKDGSGICCQVSISAMESSEHGRVWIGIFQDITDRKQMESELWESRKRWSDLCDTMEEGLCLHELVYSQPGEAVDYIITAINPAYEKITGIDRIKAVGSKASVLYGTGEPPFLDIYAKVATTGKPATFEIYWPPMDKYFRISVFSPGESQFATVFVDISEAKCAEEKIKASLKEKEGLIKEIHHRVKNHMVVVSGLISLQTRKIRDEAVAAPFREFESRVVSMALVHELLYQSTSQVDIDFEKYLSRLANAVMKTYQGDDDRISLELSAKGISLDIDQAMPCGLVLNELVSNSFKYAFPDGKSGSIAINARLLEGDVVEILISDNGVGISEDVNWSNPKTLGLSLIKNLVKGQLNGTLVLSCDVGTRVTITFPLRHRKTSLN